MNNIRPNLKTIFNECEKQGIFICLNESYCDTCNRDILNTILDDKKTYKGYVFSYSECIDSVMEQIEEEGSSLIVFGFAGKTRKDTKAVGYILESIFKKNGYEVDWNENMDKKISVVVIESDIPPHFKEKWDIQQADNEEWSEDENSSPKRKVTRASKKMYPELCRKKYDTSDSDNSDSDSDNSDSDSDSDEYTDEYEDEDKDKEEYDEDKDKEEYEDEDKDKEEEEDEDKDKEEEEDEDKDKEEEEDEEEEDETICLDGCKCCNCIEERKEDETICLYGCECWNCIEERKEAENES